MKLPTWFLPLTCLTSLGLLCACATDDRLCRELSYTCSDECEGDDCTPLTYPFKRDSDSSDSVDHSPAHSVDHHAAPDHSGAGAGDDN